MECTKLEWNASNNAPRHTTPGFEKVLQGDLRRQVKFS